MRVLVAGASGFLGQHLLRGLRTEHHEVVRLVRRPAKSDDEIQWNPSAGELDPAALDGAGAVVNLAGVSVGPPRRWTARHKKELVASRVDTTSTLARAMAALPASDRPAAFLAQSAVGYYGNTGDQPVTEDDPPGEGFLADLVRVWEAATRPAEDAGVRVLHLRTGLPLAAGGGFLQPLLWQFRLFVGGKMGSGRQYLPWIAIADWTRAVLFLLGNDAIAGSANVVGPEPVHNADFARTLGRVLGRPSFVPIPGIAMRVALGEFGTESLFSQRVLPKVLTEAGFTFQHPDLESALRAALA
jgi:uncharacterized protein (TIGR01777 family)